MALVQAEFQRLVADHGPALYRMAYRMVGDRHEAEDLVQETYRSAWKSRKTYQIPDPSSRSSEHTPGGGERAWLAAILRRRAVDRWRRHPNPAVLAGDSPIDVGIEGDDPTGQTFTDEMQHALLQLPHDLRETLLLVVVTELTHQEAADLLSVPLGTVLSRVSRARARLRELLLAATKTT